FFFSSRRRHTRFSRDWSSDVCSSDLFGLYRDMSTNPLVKQLLAYVMQDEARHVAFGRLALKDYYAELTDKERAEREEFVVEGCYLMRDRFKGREIFETLEDRKRVE